MLQYLLSSDPTFWPTEVSPLVAVWAFIVIFSAYHLRKIWIDLLEYKKSYKTYSTEEEIRFGLSQGIALLFFSFATLVGSWFIWGTIKMLSPFEVVGLLTIFFGILLGFYLISVTARVVIRLTH